MNLCKGTVVGKYRLEAPLAQGGMGAVWKARHIRLGTSVAVKFLAPALVGSRKSLARFEREAHAATVIQSQHVIQVHDFGVEGETPYLVMELLHGENLGARLQRHKRLSLAEAARILIQVGKALRRAHAAGIVHRDIKPGNLFLSYDDDEEIVKILDFGIAKTHDTPVPEQTEPGTMLGSPNYMSPEQAAGDNTVDHRSDLWSMAVVLYQTVTGELPFQGHTMGNVLKKVFIEAPPRVADIAPDLPVELDIFFGRALAKKRHERFQDIDEMVVAFVHVAAPDQSIPPPSVRYPNRRAPQSCTDSQEPCCSEKTPRSRDLEEAAASTGARLKEESTVPTVRLGRVTEGSPGAPPLSTSMQEATPSGVAGVGVHAVDTDRDLSNSVTLHGRAASRRRLAPLVPWLVVGAMLAVPLILAVFRSPDNAAPERASTAVMATGDPGGAVGGAPRMESLPLAPSVVPAEDLASAEPAASVAVADDDDSEKSRASDSAPGADPAADPGAATPTKPGGAEAPRYRASAGDARSEGDVYDEAPASDALGGLEKGAASAPGATSAPAARSGRSPSGAPSTPEKRWF